MKVLQPRIRPEGCAYHTGCPVWFQEGKRMDQTKTLCHACPYKKDERIEPGVTPPGYIKMKGARKLLKPKIEKRVARITILKR